MSSALPAIVLNLLFLVPFLFLLSVLISLSLSLSLSLCLELEFGLLSGTQGNQLVSMTMSAGRTVYLS